MSCEIYSNIIYYKRQTNSGKFHEEQEKIWKYSGQTGIMEIYFLYVEHVKISRL